MSDTAVPPLSAELAEALARKVLPSDGISGLGKALLQDRDFLMDVVAAHGPTLAFLPEAMRGDRDVVRAALSSPVCITPTAWERVCRLRRGSGGWDR